ncbi:MAG: CPBP family glutamic-type intramembrane protease [Bacteroidia bacterium]|nr:CPBP family glutamic-type intramembrane protease [Bacteroidia bacterium]MDW8159033.1 CPBP family glutamic-type intramembrane protease [Bacteroidia bacterium]
MRSYYTATQSFTYNFSLGILLLGLYHLTLHLMPGETTTINAIDHLFQKIISLIPNGLMIVNICILVGGGFYLFWDYKKGIRLKITYLIFMLLEAIVWSLLVYFNLSYFVLRIPVVGEMLQNQIGGAHLLLIPSLQNISLSLGAGFYEELFFRLILVKIFSLGMLLMLRNPNSLPNAIIIALTSAILFSAAHTKLLIGELGEDFRWYNFIYRIVFGLFMSLLIIFRGFGIAAWCHAFYDIWVFSNNPNA